ncbi:MAG: DUF2723 domain-containing protein [Caldilineae bacterium]|nr:DUF2723 domain-containing protein [Caldilineae bacterium]
MGARAGWDMNRWAGIVLVVLALVLYLLTLDNGLRPGELAGGDLVTHQYAQVQGRPGNAPGYPLYTMGGWIWFHGLRALLGATSNPTAILSSYSTLWALLALWLLYRLIVDLTGRWPLGFLGGAFYAVTYFFWYYAVSTEQYASAVAQTLAIVLLAFRWERVQDEVDRGERSAPAGDGLLLALAFLSGLALAHLVTVAFIVPPLLWFVLSRRPALLRRAGLLVKAAGLALLPVLSYLFVYIRGVQHPEWRGAGAWPSAAAWFIDFVSTRQGRSELTWSIDPFWTDGFPSLMVHELTLVVLLGGLIGIALLGRRRAIFIGSTVLIYLVFSFIDRLGNWFQVIMPVYALLVAAFMVFAAALWQRIAAWLEIRGPRWRGWLALLLILAFAGLITGRLLQNWPGADQRNRPEDTALQPGRAILADDPARNAAVLGVTDEALSLRYLTDIWGVRPDVDAVTTDQARQILAQASRPLFVTRDAVAVLREEVSATASLSSAGRQLAEVLPMPQRDLPASATALAQSVGDGLSLAGYEFREAQGDASFAIRLYWRAEGAIGHDWSVSVRPLQGGSTIDRPDGDGIVQADAASPVHGAYPTSRWAAGEVVADDYSVPIPDGAEIDGVEVVVYRQLDNGEFENLAVVRLPHN